MELEKESRIENSEASTLSDVLILLTLGYDVPEQTGQGQEIISKIWDKMALLKTFRETFWYKKCKDTL